MEFRVVRGDIARQSADALVNAAGTSLRMGSGVAGALRRRGGSELDKAAMAEGPVDFGAVAVTDAFDLDADRVIHPAAMPHYGDGKATADGVRNAARNALERADERGCESLVIPALGCGVAGFPPDEGAQIICEVIDGYDPDSLSEVRFVAYDETVRRVADGVRSDPACVRGRQTT